MRPVQRRRWAAKNPGDLWHGDVCHLVLPDGTGKTRKVLVHGFLDDASRYFVALDARMHETEIDMLEGGRSAARGGVARVRTATLRWGVPARGRGTPSA